MSKTVESRIRDRIHQHSRGWCFTLKDFVDLGSDTAIKVTVHRLVKSGEIKRLVRGIYYFPEKSEMFGDVPPSLESVAKALANKYQIKIQPSGAYAANLLGLSEQVPAKVVYLTDGDNKIIEIGKRKIIFKKTTPKNMKMAGKISGLVVQALKFVGKDHVDEKIIKKIKRKLSDKDRVILEKDAVFAPNWISKIIKNEILEVKNG